MLPVHVIQIHHHVDYITVIAWYIKIPVNTCLQESSSGAAITVGGNDSVEVFGCPFL